MEKLEWSDEDGDSGLLIDAFHDGSHEVEDELVMLVVSEPDELARPAAVFIDKAMAPKVVAFLTEFFKL